MKRFYVVVKEVTEYTYEEYAEDASMARQQALQHFYEGGGDFTTRELDPEAETI